MVALTADRNTKSRPGDMHSYPMAASQTIYKGAMVCLNSAGYAIPAAAASGNTQVVGVADEQAKSGTTAGDTSVRVVSGRVFNFAAQTLAQGSVGDIMYADDDQTIDETQASNAPKVGMLVERVSASEGWVYIPTGGLTNP